MAEATDNPDVTKFYKEIRSMMHACGDSPTPLKASAKLIESIVARQLQTLLYKAEEIAEVRGSEVIGFQDFLFILRKDKIKLHRLLKYLSIKDMKGTVSKMFQNPEDLIGGDEIKGVYKQCIDYLKTLDDSEYLIDCKSVPFDIVKHERIVRANVVSQSLDEDRYLEYQSARTVSFRGQPTKRQRFYEWLQSKNSNMTNLPPIGSLAYDILCYLAYETVAQTVDLALLCRQDAAAKPGNPFSFYTAGYTQQTSYFPQEHLSELPDKPFRFPPITPEEIREALRRFWSPVSPPWNPFITNIEFDVNSRLLMC